MSRSLIKLEREKDFYVIWSSVVDAPVGYGTKKELTRSSFINLKELLKDLSNIGMVKVDEPVAFAVADEYGSSTMEGDRSWFDWGSDEPLFYALEDGSKTRTGHVSRENFHKLVSWVMAQDKAADESRLLAQEELERE